MLLFAIPAGLASSYSMTRNTSVKKTGTFCIGLLLLLASCGDPNKGNPHFKKVDPEKAQNYRMDRWNFLMKIPKGFTTVEPEELIDNLYYADIPEEVIEYEQRRIFNYFSLHPDIQMLLSIDKPDHQILIQAEDRPIRLNPKAIKSYGQDLVNSYFEGQSGLTDLEVLENKFIVHSWFRYSKFKVSFLDYGVKSFACHYLVTSREHSFSVLYQSPDEEDDLQEYINAIEYAPN